MENKTYEIADGIYLNLKEDPTSKDLIDLRDIGIDLMNNGEYAAAIVKCHYEPEEMRKLISAIFLEPAPSSFEGNVKAKVLDKALKDFFGLYGLHFQ